MTSFDSFMEQFYVDDHELQELDSIDNLSISNDFNDNILSFDDLNNISYSDSTRDSIPTPRDSCNFPRDSIPSTRSSSTRDDSREITMDTKEIIRNTRDIPRDIPLEITRDIKEISRDIPREITMDTKEIIREARDPGTSTYDTRDATRDAKDSNDAKDISNRKSEESNLEYLELKRQLLSKHKQQLIEFNNEYQNHKLQFNTFKKSLILIIQNNALALSALNGPNADTRDILESKSEEISEEEIIKNIEILLKIKETKDEDRNPNLEYLRLKYPNQFKEFESEIINNYKQSILQQYNYIINDLNSKVNEFELQNKILAKKNDEINTENTRLSHKLSVIRKRVAKTLNDMHSEVNRQKQETWKSLEQEWLKRKLLLRQKWLDRTTIIRDHCIARHPQCSRCLLLLQVMDEKN